MLKNFNNRFVIVGAIPVTILFVFTFILFGISHQVKKPSFCLSCHEKPPHTVSLSESGHKDIKCLKCHFSFKKSNFLKDKLRAVNIYFNVYADNYNNEIYDKIENSTCTQKGCHKATGDYFIKNKLKPNKIIFSHILHIKKREKKGLLCTDCHFPRKGKSHTSSESTICILCHKIGSNKTDSDGLDNQKITCEYCHKIIPDTILSDGNKSDHGKLADHKIDCINCHSHEYSSSSTVDDSMCLECHSKNEVSRSESENRYLHTYHLGTGVKCNACHDRVLHRVDEQTSLDDPKCKLCHKEKGNETVIMLYQGRGAIGIDSWPDIMYKAGISCRACHTQSLLNSSGFKADKFTDYKIRCIGCHKDKRYGIVLEQWKVIIDVLLWQIKGKLDTIGIKLGDRSEDPKIKKAIENVQHNYSLIMNGKGVHNFAYSLYVLEKDLKKLGEITGMPILSKKKLGSKNGGVFTYSNTGDSLPVSFNHLQHQKQVPFCTECHEKYFTMHFGSASGTGVFNMRNMKKGWFCGGCHNGEKVFSVEKSCEKCHNALRASF